MTVPDAEELMEVARHLCSETGLGQPAGLSALDGGRNNRVFRVDLIGGNPVLLKSYFRDARDPRDRRRAEWEFLEYAWRRGIRSVPEPIATDVAAGVSLLGFVAGQKVAPGLLGTSQVDAAVSFAVALNEAPRDVNSLAAASEACFSIVEHIATVDRRVARLRDLDATAACVEEAEAFVAQRLDAAWLSVRGRIEVGATSEALAQRLAADQECASPSDFGFHNALITVDGGITFLDFEYAGRDDPAKLVCDFFCQPEVPVPISHFPRFVGTLRDTLGFEATFAGRCDLLLDAYRIKWVCIMLNDFLPLGDARRSFAVEAERSARCRAQLDKAIAALAAVTIT